MRRLRITPAPFQSNFEAITRILFFIKDKTRADVDARQMERCLWLISVASKRQWSAEHRDALSVLHSDLVLGPVDAAAVFTQATYTRYTSAPPRLDAAPARLPRNVSMLENPASIPHPEPVAPVSGPGPICPPPVPANVPAAKRPRKVRSVQ